MGKPCRCTLTLEQGAQGRDLRGPFDPRAARGQPAPRGGQEMERRRRVHRRRRVGAILGSPVAQGAAQACSAYAEQSYQWSVKWPTTLQRRGGTSIALLLITTDKRASNAIARFERRWAQAHRHLGRSLYLPERAAPELGACAAARAPEEALREPMWLSAGSTDGLHLTDLLRPAWQNWAEEQARRRDEETRLQQWRASLLGDPERCRREIQRSGSVRGFGAPHRGPRWQPGHRPHAPAAPPDVSSPGAGSRTGRSGGPDRNRTDDLIHAMDALYRLSYGPVSRRC